MTIDPTLDNRFSILSDDDRAFLKQIFPQYPQIERNFDVYLNIPQGFTRMGASIEGMKNLRRSGWVKRGIPEPESVATHSGVLAYLTLLNLQPPTVDNDRVLRMAIYHDWPEVIITDFTPTDNIDENAKARLEVIAITVLTQGLPNANTAIAFVREYAEQKTPEARWLHDLDKLDAVITALTYEGRYPDKHGIFEGFLNHALPKLKTDEGRELANSIRENAGKIRMNFSKRSSSASNDQSLQ